MSTRWKYPGLMQAFAAQRSSEKFLLAFGTRSRQKDAPITRKVFGAGWLVRLGHKRFTAPPPPAAKDFSNAKRDLA
jgi:hypothetical protein